MGKKGVKQPRYPSEQKAEALRLVRESHQSVYKVAHHLGIPESTLSNWIRQARIDEGSGPPGALTTVERAEIRRLRRENKTLRMERDFLKKAAAFFAKEDEGAST